MRRWVSEKQYITNDQERLQHIIVHSPCEDKVKVKAENKGFNYTRLLLVPKKEQRDTEYIVAKISRV